MKIMIRPADAEDIEDIACFQEDMALHTEGKRLDPDVIRSGVTRVLEDGAKGRYLVVDVDGHTVGSLLLTLEWSDWRDGWFWWIQSVWIQEHHRRRGLYRALHQEVRRQARQASAEGEPVIGIRLYVEKDNQRAQRTYEAMGMSATDYLLYEEALSSGP